MREYGLNSSQEPGSERARSDGKNRTIRTLFFAKKEEEPAHENLPNRLDRRHRIRSRSHGCSPSPRRIHRPACAICKSAGCAPATVDESVSRPRYPRRSHDPRDDSGREDPARSRRGLGRETSFHRADHGGRQQRWRGLCAGHRAPRHLPGINMADSAVGVALGGSAQPLFHSCCPPPWALASILEWRRRLYLYGSSHRPRAPLPKATTCPSAAAST